MVEIPRFWLEPYLFFIGITFSNNVLPVTVFLSEIFEIFDGTAPSNFTSHLHKCTTDIGERVICLGHSSGILSGNPHFQMQNDKMIKIM